MTLILLAIAWMLGIVAADLLHLPLPPLLDEVNWPGVFEFR